VRPPQSRSSKRRPSEAHSPKRQSRSVEKALRKIAEELADSPKPKSSRSRSPKAESPVSPKRRSCSRSAKAESPVSPKARSCSRSSKVESPESPQSRWIPPPATELKHRSRSRSAAGKSPDSSKTELSASPPQQSPESPQRRSRSRHAKHSPARKLPANVFDDDAAPSSAAMPECKVRARSRSGNIRRALGEAPEKRPRLFAAALGGLAGVKPRPTPKGTDEILGKFLTEVRIGVPPGDLSKSKKQIQPKPIKQRLSAWLGA